MEFLISFYDNALVYYPNVFFAILFFVSILGIIIVNIGVILLWKKVKRVIQEIKNDLKQIRIKERKKISFSQMIRIFFQRKKISFFYFVRVSTVFLIRMVRVAFIRTNTALGYIESQTEKIIKKIGKEILIEE